MKAKMLLVTFLALVVSQSAVAINVTVENHLAPGGFVSASVSLNSQRPVVLQSNQSSSIPVGDSIKSIVFFYNDMNGPYKDVNGNTVMWKFDGKKLPRVYQNYAPGLRFCIEDGSGGFSMRFDEFVRGRLTERKEFFQAQAVYNTLSEDV